MPSPKITAGLPAYRRSVSAHNAMKAEHKKHRHEAAVEAVIRFLAFGSISELFGNITRNIHGELTSVTRFDPRPQGNTGRNRSCVISLVDDVLTIAEEVEHRKESRALQVASQDAAYQSEINETIDHEEKLLASTYGFKTIDEMNAYMKDNLEMIEAVTPTEAITVVQPAHVEQEPIALLTWVTDGDTAYARS